LQAQQLRPSLDPHVAGAQPIAQLGQHAELERPPIKGGAVDTPSPRCAQENQRHVGRQLAQATAAEVAHDGHGMGERSAGRRRAEGEGGDERRPDLAEDRHVRAGKLDGIERVRADEATCFLDLRRQCIPTDDALDGRERVGSPSRAVMIASPSRASRRILVLMVRR